MGRPTTKKAQPGIYRDEPEHADGASMSSAMSLHSNIGYEDDDNDGAGELPPYTDDPSDVYAAPPDDVDSRSYDQAPLMRDSKITETKSVDQKGTRLVRLSPVLTTDPIALKAYILEQSKHELQAQIAISGTHESTRRTSDNKTKKETVTDFSFYIDVTDTISRRRQQQACWSALEIVSNDRKTYRAGILKSRDKRFRADVEATHETASLEEWCHLFCASSSKLKTFTLRRKIIDRDEAALRDAIESIIRSTRYRGRVSITFPTHVRSVEVTTPHLLNRLRNNVYVYWACIFLQLWVLTWPMLFLMTRRWDVVEVVFPFKKAVRTGAGRGQGLAGQGEGEEGLGEVEYVKESEVEWARKWAYTIRQGCIRKINEGSSNGKTPQLMFIDEVEEEGRKARAAREVDASISQQGGFLGSALGFVRGGLAVAGEWSAGQEWGYDD